MCVCVCMTLCDPMTVACQASLSMEFSRQEYWSGLPFSEDLPNPGIKPECAALQADSLLSEPPEVLHSVMSDSLQSNGLYPTRLLCPWDFPGKHTGVGCHFLLQRIFLTQGSNPGFPHCRQMLYRLSHREAPKHKISVQLLSRVRLFATP